MSSNSLYLRDTYFCEAIEYLKTKSLASLMILKVHYENRKIERYMNEIGKKILESTGKPFEVSLILNSYA